MIGHACKDEYGKYKNGKSGDQTKVEVYIRSWYKRPWSHVIRFNDVTMREKIAICMEHSCANNLIGYDQNQRNTLLTQARKVGYDPAKVIVPCETDCSADVSLCCIYAGVPESVLYVGGNSCTTSTLRNRLLSTGKVTVLTDSKYRISDAYLLRGDILLYEGHHVAVNLTDGSKVTTNISQPTISQTITTNQEAINKAVQSWMNAYLGTNILEDGLFGSTSKKHLNMCLEKALGLTSRNGVISDSELNMITYSKVFNSLELTKVLEAYLFVRGYNPQDFSGRYIDAVGDTVELFQKNNGLGVDGEAGKLTFKKAIF